MKVPIQEMFKTICPCGKVHFQTVPKEIAEHVLKDDWNLCQVCFDNKYPIQKRKIEHPTFGDCERSYEILKNEGRLNEVHKIE